MLIGRIATPSKPGEELQKEWVLKSIKMGECLQLYPVYELNSSLQVSPQGVGKMALAVFFAYTIDKASKAPVYVRATGVQFFDDMEKSDRERYKKFMDSADKFAVAARAKAAGLQVVPQGPGSA
jgi:hypothetical protein